MSEFDIKANDWDKNIVNIERAREISNQLLLTIPFRPGMKVMEFGAGTALLSFMLEDLFASVTLIDNSVEMIRICNEKIAQTKSNHIQALKIDLETESFEEKFDVIYTQMAFHHVSDIGKMVQKLHHLLNNSGILAIADLYPEDGSFHGEGFTGHLGFDPEWLSTLLNQSGFENVTFKECFVQKKIDSDGKQKEYPVFLMIANKIFE
jgi:tRNA (cmo5U34)-methyltransferase